MKYKVKKDIKKLKFITNRCGKNCFNCI